MIIKGNPARNVGFWSKYLLGEKHEHAELKEIRGLVAEDLPSALREMKAIAAQSRSHGNFMYQANINPRAEEHLTPAQWATAVETLEKNLGLEGHQRVVVEHVNNGRQHYHVVWNRVDVETLKVVDMGGNWPIHEKTARELEECFGLTPTLTPAPEKAPERKSAQELWEIRAAERSGIDPNTLKTELTDLWHKTDSGQAFAAALDERGLILAKGDRRDFCVIDQAGDAHSLARRLEGVNAKDVRARMVDIDREALPSVREARETQRAAERERTPLGSAAGAVRLAWNLSDSINGFVATLDANGMSLARVDANEAAASVRVHDFAKALGNHSPRYTEGEIVVVNSFGNVQRLDERTTGQSREEIAKALGGIDTRPLLNITDTHAVMKEVARLEFFEEHQAARDISPTEMRIQNLQRESASPGAFAAALYREGLTIARADAPGIEGLARDQRTAFAVDGKVMYAPTVAEGELVAVNSYGGVHRLNPSKLDIDGIENALTAGNKTIPSLGYARDEIALDRAENAALRNARNETYWGERRERMDAALDDRVAKWEKKAAAERARIDPVGVDSLTKKPALMVVDAASRAAVSLTGFVSGLVATRAAAPPDFMTGGQMAQIRAQRRARVALDNISEYIEQGKGLKAEDVQNLTSSQLENIRLRGDDYLRSIIASNERNRAREIDYGRTREQ
jgi:hypothetical protein